MSRRSLVRALIPTSIIALALATGATLLRADNNGRTGRTATGCTCHGSTSTTGVTVAIDGPQAVRPSTTNTYTVTVTGGPATTNGGFDLRASGGTLLAGTGNHVSGSDVTHSTASTRSWTFQWTSPATLGPLDFFAVGLAADGNNGTSGDQWNWYGGAANTAFTIQVTDQLTAPGDHPLTWLASAKPNPLVTRSELSFSLAQAGAASLEAFDAAGRRVATLASGVQPAGRQTIAWTGTDDAGSPLARGLYFLRLRTADRDVSTRVLIAH